MSDDNTKCSWLVSMTAKANGELRVGVGTYLWTFEKKPTLVKSLIITIDEMVILEPQHSTLIMNWLSKLPHPWCDTSDIKNSMPELEGLPSI